MVANNYAIQFTSTAKDRIDFGASALGTSIKDTSAFTLEAWIKVGPNATTNLAKAYLERQGSGKYPRLALAAWNYVERGIGKLRFEFARVDGTQDTNYTYNLATLWDDYWHHVAFTVDIGNKEYCIYLDFALVAKGSIPDGGKDANDNALKVSNTTPQAIILGAGYDGTTYTYWDGKIDNVRVWKSQRSQNALQTYALDHLATPGNETDLLEEWRLNEGTGSTVAGAKNTSWTATLRRNGSASSALWTTDRPFMGDGNQDETPPNNFTMKAPTNITADGFTLNWNATTDDVYVQYYELTVATDTNFSSPVPGLAALNVGRSTSYTVTGLAPSTNYYARVRALDAALNASDYATYNNNAPITTLSQGDVTPPTAPTATAATSITATSFVANWTAATDNVGVTGYKLDVARDAAFTDFVVPYRNLDVGNVLTYAISSGIEPTTAYYYRVRAYDAAENESADSNVVTVTTASPPDTTPPDVVVLAPATSVASRSFTANWNVGVDNVAVIGYYLDVAYDSDFTTFVAGYQNRNVGNVTSFGVTGLDPQTTYYYRVRAYDAAGNVSSNTTTPEEVVTTPSTVDDGGLLEFVLEPTADTWINEAAPTTNYGAATTLQVVGTTNARRRAFLRFDLREVVGTIVNANLSLYVSNASAGTITVERVTGTWDEMTLTWANNTLTFTGETVTFVKSTEGWVEVDIASLLTEGPAEYTIALHTTSTDDFVVDSREGTNRPFLTLDVDPVNATEVRTLTAAGANVNLTNLLKNPSAEIGGPSFGGTTGIMPLTSATLAQDTTYAYEGQYSVRVTTAATAGSGVAFESPSGLAIPGGGQTFRAVLHGRANSRMRPTARLRLIYTDATVTDGPAVACGFNTEWKRFTCSAVGTSGKTVDRVEVHISQTDATARTFWVDAVAVVRTSGHLAFFDGDISPDTDWDGIPNASPSTFEAVTLGATATYVGDGDGDNSVVVAYKRATDSEWFTPPITPTISRTTKQVTATIGPLYLANECPNPSFEADAVCWSTVGSSLVVTDEAAWVGDKSGLWTITDTSQGPLAGCNATPATVAGEAWTYTVRVQAKQEGRTLRLRTTYADANGSVLATNIVTSPTLPVGQWVEVTQTTTAPANSDEVAFAVLADTNAQNGDAYYLDGVQFERSSVQTPYVDGDHPDGEWEGQPHRSESYRVLRHETEYDVRITFADPDGVVGTNPISTRALTLAVPDDTLTVVSLSVVPENTALRIAAQYLGDDNQSATAKVEWKRSDLAVWSLIPHVWDRQQRYVLAEVGNLKPGTSYDVRVTFTDDDDGVYGPNPIQQTAVTTITGLSAEAATRITFGGFVLMGDPDHYVGVLEHDAFSLPERRTQVEVLPRMDGAVELSDYWGKRVIRMRGYIAGESRADLNEKVREFRKALAPRQQRLVVDTLDAKGFYFNATCTSLTIPEVGGETIHHVIWDAEFTCADPFRYESAETTEQNIALNDGESVVITNSGDLRIEPTIVVTTTSVAPLSFSLINVTTSERIRPQTTIVSGDKIVIDSSRLIVTKNGVEIDYEGAFPMLAVGQNTIKATTTGGTILVTIRRRHRFF